MPREDHRNPDHPNPSAGSEPPLIVRKLTAARPATNDATPMEGSGKTTGDAAGRLQEGTSGSPGVPLTHRELYVLTRRDGGELLVLPAGEGGREKALPVFTDREHAILYRQASALRDYEPTSLSPVDMGAWLKRARGEGVTLLAVDPNRLAQERGQPQPALSLEGWENGPADALYRELRAIREQPAP